MRIMKFLAKIEVSPQYFPQLFFSFTSLPLSYLSSVPFSGYPFQAFRFAQRLSTAIRGMWVLCDFSTIPILSISRFNFREWK